VRDPTAIRSPVVLFLLGFSSAGPRQLGASSPMSKKIFISYSHAQRDWVVDRLASSLRGGGAEVLIDLERFRPGKGLVGQMDETQDEADIHVLVLSPEYLASDPCRHEMERAIALDPEFRRGVVVPVLRIPCPLPESIRRPDPLYVDLRDDRGRQAWDRLLEACDADLGCDATEWLDARDQTRRYLEDHQSVNLVVTGKAAWGPLIADLRRDLLARTEPVDLHQGRTASRQGLVEEILRVCGAPTKVPEPPGDLIVLDRVLSTRPPAFLVLQHFDIAAHEDRRYGVDLFAALRFLMENKNLILLVQSRKPFYELVPRDHFMSCIESLLVMVELRGRP